jgi:hypothetical protein
MKPVKSKSFCATMPEVIVAHSLAATQRAARIVRIAPFLLRHVETIALSIEASKKF